MKIVAKDKSTALGARIRSLREAAGYSQEDAARELDVTRQTYIRYENGGTEPTFGDVCKLAALFGVDVTAFVVADEEGRAERESE